MGTLFFWVVVTLRGYPIVREPMKYTFEDDSTLFPKVGLSGFASHFDAKKSWEFSMKKSTEKRDPMRPAPLLRIGFPQIFRPDFSMSGGFTRR